MSRPLNRESLLPPLWVVVLGFLAATIWLLIELKEVCTLLVVGYCIAYMLDPVLRGLERIKISRTIGFFVVCSVAVIVVALFVLTALPVLSNEFSSLLERFPEYVEVAKQKLIPKLLDLKKYLPADLAARISHDPGASAGPSLSSEAADKVIEGMKNALLGGYSLTLTLLNLALLPFIVFYLAVDFHSIHANLLGLFPLLEQRWVKKVALEIDTYVSAFVRGQVLVGAIEFILYLVGLGFVGVQLWLILAFISGFGAIIPYVGFALGIVLSSIMALVTFGDFTHLFQVWAIYIAVQALEGMVIVPKVVGNKVGLSPLVVTLAIFAGGKLFGILGIFLAIPTVAVIRVLGRHFYAWILDRR